MTKITIIIFLLLSGISHICFAQTQRSSFRTNERNIDLEKSIEPKFVYLFEEFKSSTVYVGAEQKNYKVNYRLLHDLFSVLETNNEIKTLGKDFKFDSLVVEGMTFILHPEFGYLEKINPGQKPYYIKYQTTFSMQEIKQGAYGEAPATASVQSVNILAGQAHTLTTTGEYLILENTTGNPVRVNIVSGPTFGYIQNNQFVSIESRRDLNRIFPEHTSQIRRFLRNEGIAFDQRNDLIQLATYLNTIE